MREKETTPLLVPFFLLSFFCSLTSHRIPLPQRFEQAILSIKGLKYLTIINTTYQVMGIGSLLKNVITFFFTRELMTCQKQLYVMAQKRGWAEICLLLVNVKFKLLSVVSVVDGSRFKNIFPQYRRNHAVSCETAVW